MAAAPIFATVAPQWSPVMKTGNTSGVAAGTTGMRVPQWSPVMKTGNTLRDDPEHSRTKRASMEPGHEDREYRVGEERAHVEVLASMEPGHEDREYPQLGYVVVLALHASMEPGHEDREYPGRCGRQPSSGRASMEPGHEDREYFGVGLGERVQVVPQWSPVMKTGNTRRVQRELPLDPAASMEPGHEDREYRITDPGTNRVSPASMEPGHEDREYGRVASHTSVRSCGLNGARS